MSVADISGFHCVICGRMYGADEGHTCPDCGAEGILDIRFEYRRVRESFKAKPLLFRQQGLWRYPELLPVDPNTPRPTLCVGGTPLADAPRLAAHIGVRRLQLKDEGLNPTGSVKDRSGMLAVVKAMEAGIHTVACGSVGNAASSLAGMAASVGLRAYVFVPHLSSESNIRQSLAFGAAVVRVNGTHTDAVRLAAEACSQWDWYNANLGFNPYLIEGTKTLGLEIAEATKAEVPDWVVLPVGNGCTFAAIWKGLQEMQTLGVLPHRPRMLGVQAQAVAPIATAFQQGRDLEPRDGETVADGIGIGRPANWRKALRAARESDGGFVTVSDDEILDAVRTAARLTGVFAEPAAAAAIAGIHRAVAERTITPRDSVLAVLTGNGLKNIPAGRFIPDGPIDVDPELGKFELELARRRSRHR